MTRLRSEMRSLRSLVAQLEAGKSDGFTISPEELDAALESDTRLNALAGQIALLERKVDKEAAVATLGRDEPLVQAIQKELDAKRAELKAKGDGLRKSIVARLKADQGPRRRRGPDFPQIPADERSKTSRRWR